MGYEDHVNDTAALAAYIEGNLSPELHRVPREGHAPFMVLPKTMEPHSIKQYLDEYLERPERRVGRAELDDVESLIAHVNRFKRDTSAVFAHRESARMVAVLDYHEAGPEGKADWCGHTAAYAFPFSEEWTAWTGSDGKQMAQAQFAAFIEDHIADVGDPAKAGQSIKDLAAQLSCELATPAKLMELSRGMAVNVNAKVANSQNLSSGEAVVQFAEEHTDGKGQKLKVPGAFMLTIPVFRNGAHYMVAARLRYRATGGGIVWWFQLYRTDRIFDDAFREAAELVAEKTSLPVFYGKPE